MTQWAAGESLVHDLAREVTELLQNNDHTLSVAESLTAGMVGSILVTVPNASKSFKGGIIAYDDWVKVNILGVPASVLSNYGAVSSECASVMASEVRSKFQTSIGIATTGNAGPSGSEDKPVGLVYIAIDSEYVVYGEELKLEGDRNEIREQVVVRVLELIKKSFQ